MRTSFRRFLATLLAASLGLAGFSGGALAAPPMISTERVAASLGLAPLPDPHARMLAALDRADVAKALADRGVSLAQARARIAALSDFEAARLAADIDRSPAGAGELIGSLILIFVALMFTDIMGYTHIFPFLHRGD